MFVGDELGYGQAEAETFGLSSAAGGVFAEKTLKNMRQSGRLNPLSVVGNGDLCRIFKLAAGNFDV